MRLTQSPAICWKPRKEQRSASGRRAFSLIELIVALALSVVLISAIYSAISLHWRYETLGRERINRAQVSLAILRRMSEDLGSVMFSVPAVTETEEEAETTTTDSATDEETESTFATTSVTPVSLGIVGTANSLQLDVSQLQLQDFVPVVDPSEPVATTPSIPSELVRVTWTLIRPQRSADPSATGLQSLIINPALVRDLVDRLQESVPDEVADASSTVTEIPDSSILAREVVELQFRYFDGYSWVAEWDSTEMGRLPRAVEVSLGFLNQEYRPASATNSPGSVSITTVKHVIQVPASTPVTGSEI